MAPTCEHEVEFVERLTQVEGKAERNEGRIKKLETETTALQQLTASVSSLAAREERVESDVKEIKADVKSLAAKPGKRYDDLMDKVIWAVAAAVIAFILGRIGL